MSQGSAIQLEEKKILPNKSEISIESPPQKIEIRKIEPKSGFPLLEGRLKAFYNSLLIDAYQIFNIIEINESVCFGEIHCQDLDKY